MNAFASALPNGREWGRATVVDLVSAKLWLGTDQSGLCSRSKPKVGSSARASSGADSA